MEQSEDGLEDVRKRAELDGCGILTFAGILGLVFEQQGLSEREGIDVVSGHSLVLMVAVCWCGYDRISIVGTLHLSGWHLEFTLLVSRKSDLEPPSLKRCYVCLTCRALMISPLCYMN